MTRSLMSAIVAATLICGTCLEAQADPGYSASLDVSGEVNYFNQQLDFQPSPVSISGSPSIPTGTSASGTSTANYQQVSILADVAGAGDFSEGINVGGFAIFQDIRTFLDDQNQPIGIANIEVNAFYSAALSATGPASGASANFLLEIFSQADAAGDFDEATFSNSGGSGTLTASYTGDLSLGVSILLDSSAGATGGTYELGNPTIGHASTQFVITSIYIDGVPVYIIPEPSTWAILSLGAVGLVGAGRRKWRRIAERS